MTVEAASVYLAAGINVIHVVIHENRDVTHAGSYRKLVEWAGRTAGGPAVLSISGPEKQVPFVEEISQG